MADIVVYHCGEAYHTDSSNIGKTIRCRHCDQVFTIEGDAHLQELFSRSYPEETLQESKRRVNRVYMQGHKTEWQRWVLWVAGILIIIFLAFKYSTPTTENPPSTDWQDTNTSKAIDNPIPQPVLLNRSLPNGADIIPPIGKGIGKITVKNGNSQDAFVEIVDGEQAKQGKYVKAYSKVIFKNIASGIYTLKYGIGTDFNGKIFTRDDIYGEFDEFFTFLETTTYEGDYSHTKGNGYTVTLNPVIGGNASTHGITKEEFKGVKPLQISTIK